jgi:hypothetical protein
MRGRLVGVIRDRGAGLDLSYALGLGVVATAGDGIVTFRHSAQLDALRRAA